MLRASWPELFEDIQNCNKCPLCEHRTHVVPGEGNPEATLMFIGEGPGQEEDRQGRPFVGPSGELLTRMIHAIGLERSEVYICNIVKCRPLGNRNPMPDEAAACLPYLRKQFVLVRPKIIVLLGRVAASTLLDAHISINASHGSVYERKGVLFIPTFHPSALLRSPELKRDAWDDFQIIRDRLRAVQGESAE